VTFDEQAWEAFCSVKYCGMISMICPTTPAGVVGQIMEIIPQYFA
jgi:hypothetical protein